MAPRCLVAACLLLLVAPARAAPEREGGPPGGQTGPGDVMRPVTGAPGAPKAPGTPLVRGEQGIAAGQASLLELLASATGSEASGLAPSGFLDAIFGPAMAMSSTEGGAAGVSAVPIPFGAYSLNEGTTGGLLVPIWFTNNEGDVEGLLTPIASYNKIFGAEAGAHVGVYTRDTLVSAGAVVSNHIARNIYFQALAESALGTPFAFELFAKNEVDPASRFYGFGAQTTAADATNDTHRETVWRLNTGLDVTPGLQFFWRQRFRDVDIGAGRVDSLPKTPDVFPHAPGLPRSTIWGTGVELRWDLRDEAFLPHRGIFAAFVGEANFGLAGETTPFYPRMIVDFRAFFTPFDGPLTIAFRGRGEGLAGSRVPFYEQAILGGRNSLRAFGEDRFTDLASLLFQVEARISVVDFKIFGTRVILQVVPFFDEGRVFHSWEGSLARFWQWSPGCGFRLAVPPSFVARVDVAYGSEGSNVFAGLGLPF